MGRLDDKVAVVTGAGRGIGREIALLMAAEGARVGVNDLGGAADRTGAGNVAEQVCAEVRAQGGEAVPNTESVAELAGGESLLQKALEAFGGMDILTSEILHTGSGGVGIMQQPAVIKRFQKAGGVWGIEELDAAVPQLVGARRANIAANEVE